MTSQTITGHRAEKTSTANSTLQTGNANSTKQASTANLNVVNEAKFRLATLPQTSGPEGLQKCHRHSWAFICVLLLLPVICIMKNARGDIGQTPAWQFQRKGREMHMAMGQYHNSRDPQKKSHMLSSGHEGIKDDRQLQGCEDTDSGDSSELHAAPTHEPGPSIWMIQGPCTSSDEGICVQSPNHPSSYGSGEKCTILQLDTSLVMTVAAFDTEGGFDFLYVSDIAYSGTAGPPNGLTSVGDMIWASDGGAELSGWKICARAPNTPATGGTCGDPDPNTNGTDDYVCASLDLVKSVNVSSQACTDAASCNANCCKTPCTTNVDCSNGYACNANVGICQVPTSPINIIE